MNLIEHINRVNQARLQDANRKLPFTCIRETLADYNRSRALVKRIAGGAA